MESLPVGNKVGGFKAHELSISAISVSTNCISLLLFY